MVPGKAASAVHELSESIGTVVEAEENLAQAVTSLPEEDCGKEDVVAETNTRLIKVQPLHFGAEEEEYQELANLVMIFPYQGHELITPRSCVSTPETHPDLRFQDSVMKTEEVDVGLGHKLIFDRSASQHCLVKYVPAREKVSQWLDHCGAQAVAVS